MKFFSPSDDLSHSLITPSSLGLTAIKVDSGGPTGLGMFPPKAMANVLGFEMIDELMS